MVRVLAVVVLVVVFFVGCIGPSHMGMALKGASLVAADEFHRRLTDRCSALGYLALYEGALTGPPPEGGLYVALEGGLRLIAYDSGQWSVCSYMLRLASPDYGPSGGPEPAFDRPPIALFRLQTPPASSETVALTVKGEQMVFSVEKAGKSWLLPQTETSVVSLLQSCSDDQWPPDW